MTLLLDTHTLMWFISNDTQLSAVAKSHIEHLDNINGARTALSASFSGAVRADMAVRAPTGRFMESFDLQHWTHIGAMNRSGAERGL